jgi:hypothetical protein
VEQVAAEAGHLLRSLRVGVDRVVDGEAGVGPGEHAFDLLALELAAALEPAEQPALKQSLRGQGIGRVERGDRALRIDEAGGDEGVQVRLPSRPIAIGMDRDGHAHAEAIGIEASRPSSAARRRQSCWTVRKAQRARSPSRERS